MDIAIFSLKLRIFVAVNDASARAAVASRPIFDFIERKIERNRYFSAKIFQVAPRRRKETKFGTTSIFVYFCDCAASLRRLGVNIGKLFVL